MTGRESDGKAGMTFMWRLTFMLLHAGHGGRGAQSQEKCAHVDQGRQRGVGGDGDYAVKNIHRL
jgi:hypothetical protein